MNITKEEMERTDPTIEVVCRFRKSELSLMKHETGAEKNAGAVAAYCRKSMKRAAGAEG